MKKVLFFALTIAMCCGLSQKISAQDYAYEKGSKVLNLGIGVGGYYDFGFGAPGVSASFEVGIWPTGQINGRTFGVIGLGAYSGFRIAVDDRAFADVTYTTFAIAPRATYHFTIIPVDKLDVYAAVQINTIFEGISYEDDLFESSSDVLIDAGLVAGVRYYFSDRFGVFGELGYNLNYVTGGISLSF